MKSRRDGLFSRFSPPTRVRRCRYDGPRAHEFYSAYLPPPGTRAMLPRYAEFRALAQAFISLPMPRAAQQVSRCRRHIHRHRHSILPRRLSGHQLFDIPSRAFCYFTATIGIACQCHTAWPAACLPIDGLPSRRSFLNRKNTPARQLRAATCRI